MNARGMKYHPYLIKMSCPLSKRMGRADEPTVCTSRINTKHIFDGQAAPRHPSRGPSHIREHCQNINWRLGIHIFRETFVVSGD